ncbi:MAG TPA: nuclear transport factor 2 family protein [Dehalococcoidia bacterium]|nr:nuclear transport factor 2 family protein [Dehalococcoidia bacterium]
MPEQENIESVRQLYASFQRGDIPAILAQLADDVAWHEPPAGPPPFGGLHRGREAVGRFFQQLGELVEAEEFQPRQFLAQGERVVALGSYRFRVRETGRAWQTDWAMLWDFRDGQVVRF